MITLPTEEEKPEFNIDTNRNQDTFESKILFNQISMDKSNSDASPFKKAKQKQTLNPYSSKVTKEVNTSPLNQEFKLIFQGAHISPASNLR